MSGMNRAYSLVEFKAADDGSGRITGIATTPDVDRMGDIVEPKGAVIKLPLPLLWQHDPSSPIGNVTEATITAKGIKIVAEIARGVTDEIDRAYALIKAGLVRGLSIGFRGLDSEQIPNSYGIRFNSWEMLELSAVTIPANAAASIQTVKHYDSRIAAPGIVRLRQSPGASGSSGVVRLRESIIRGVKS